MDSSTSTQLDTQLPCTESPDSAQRPAMIVPLPAWQLEVGLQADAVITPEAPHLWSEIFSMQLVS
jgi:hypothetical protein